MIRSILFILLFAIIIGASVIVFLEAKKSKKIIKNGSTIINSKQASKTKITVGLVVAALSLGLVVTIPGSFHQVETGTVAVVRELGKITGIREPGTHFDFYFVKSYEIYDTKVQQDKINTQAYSKDGQTMGLEVFLQYQVQIENIIKIATEYGNLDALQARIETVAIEKTKSVMSSAEAMNIIQNRASYSDQVSAVVRAGISSDYYVNVKDVVLTNIDFTSDFEKSVEDKVIAEQEKQAAITKAEAELEVAKLEAQKKIEEAEGNAKAQVIIAQAAAQAATAKFVEVSRTVGYDITETTDAEGITTYVIDTTTGPGADKFKSLVEDYLEYITYLEKWDGTLPTVLSGTDAVSIIMPAA